MKIFNRVRNMLSEAKRDFKNKRTALKRYVSIGRRIYRFRDLQTWLIISLAIFVLVFSAFYLIVMKQDFLQLFNVMPLLKLIGNPDFLLNLYAGIPIFIIEVVLLVFALPYYLNKRENVRWQPVRGFMATAVMRNVNIGSYYVESILEVLTAIRLLYEENDPSIHNKQLARERIETYTKLYMHGVEYVLRDIDLFSSAINSEMANALLEMVDSLRKLSENIHLFKQQVSQFTNEAVLEGIPAALKRDLNKDVSKLTNEKARNYIIFELGMAKYDIERLENSGTRLVFALESVKHNYASFKKVVKAEDYNLFEELYVRKDNKSPLIDQLKKELLHLRSLAKKTDAHYNQLVQKYAVSK